MLLAAAGLPAYDAGKLNASSGSGGGSGGTPTSSAANRPSAASALMKTLSVRLHRGTEFIKDTVQKALVMSAPNPAAPNTAAPPPAVAPSTSSGAVVPVKRKLSGAGGLMGCSITSSNSSLTRHLIIAREAQLQARQQHLAQLQAQKQQQEALVPTAAFLRTYTVPPTELHRSEAARKRNPSTDSLLMDLCVFKPIRPMPITPIKMYVHIYNALFDICNTTHCPGSNKFRGFELKKPKFVAATNPDSDDSDEDDNDDEDDEEEASVRKPKQSNLTLPTKGMSAFVPVPYVQDTTNTAITNTTATTSSRSRSRSHNTHTSGSGANANANPNPKPQSKPKRRRRGPLLTAKKRRKAPLAGSTTAAEAKPCRASMRVRGASEAVAANSPVISLPPAKRKATSGGEVAKRSRGASAATTTSLASTSVSPAVAKRVAAKRKIGPADGGSAAKRGRGASAPSPRPSPPMTRQRARQQISASK
ncbi:hypothetical protein KR018_010499 [Drosophila ironensis]|nr:hypothetical protein KR018_010499 [Drosophila ironensis]